MSLKVEGTKCAVCHAYLFEEDDVVYCPDCGAPHHRDCYNSVGHCGLEQFHGTDKQYSAVKEREEQQSRKQTQEQATNSANTMPHTNIICPACHIDYDINMDSCPNCSAPNRLKLNRFAGFDLLGGVPADYPIAEDVTAAEAQRFVTTNTHRYIPKFATLNRKNKLSWNWLAFLFPCGWFLSRKMYRNGIIAGIFTVISTLFSIPLNNAMYNMGLSEATYYGNELFQMFSEALPEIGAAAIITAAAGAVLSLILRIVCGIFGDYLYKNHTVLSIRKIKASDEDIDNNYRRLGGVNLFLFVIGVMAVQYIPSIISMFM